jgi:hypothetical protein
MKTSLSFLVALLCFAGTPASAETRRELSQETVLLSQQLVQHAAEIQQKLEAAKLDGTVTGYDSTVEERHLSSTESETVYTLPLYRAGGSHTTPVVRLGTLFVQVHRKTYPYFTSVKTQIDARPIED